MPPPALITAAPPSRARGVGPRRERHQPGVGAIPVRPGSRNGSAGRRCKSWDHPRGRGEQVRPGAARRHGTGPSPRARGAAGRPRYRRTPPGTIPAGAGSSRSRSGTPPGRGDHPRGRGEQVAPGFRALVQQGPSPRARGAGAAHLVGQGHVGTIPAGAGSRCKRSCLHTRLRDHPRGRGEQRDVADELEGGEGPSPRARGAGLGLHQFGGRGGTIPAGAGSRSWPAFSWRRRRDHPRRRGEQQTPTAGGLGWRDHPRRRGEQGRRRGHYAPGGGPSPQARGAVVVSPSAAGRRGDHPRRRGEQTVAQTTASAVPGPSPQARGAGRFAGGRAGDAGTIPAGAGSSLVDLQCYASGPQKFATCRDSDISDIASLAFAWLGRVFKARAEAAAVWFFGRRLRVASRCCGSPSACWCCGGFKDR